MYSLKGVELPEVPFSSATAPGLVVAHGNVGDGLSTDAPDLFISNDGGYTWNRRLKGAHRRLSDTLIVPT